MDIEELKKAIRKGFETANCRNEYTKEPYPYFDSQILSIANCLLEAGYRKIIPNVDFVVRCGDLVNIREKAYNDARKETAKEIFQELHDEAKAIENKKIVLSATQIKNFAKNYYGVEVDE